MAKGTPFNQRRNNPNKKHRQRVKDRTESLTLIGKARSVLVVPKKNTKGSKGEKKHQRRLQHLLREQALKEAAKTGTFTVKEAAMMLDQ